MTEPTPTDSAEPQPKRTGIRSWWHRSPLYLRIMGAVAVGVVVGVVLGPQAEPLEIPSKLVLRLLGALAPPLILLAVIQALMRTQLKGSVGLRLARLLITNTVVAILIGLGV